MALRRNQTENDATIVNKTHVTSPFHNNHESNQLMRTCRLHVWVMGPVMWHLRRGRSIVLFMGREGVKFIYEKERRIYLWEGKEQSLFMRREEDYLWKGKE